MRYSFLNEEYMLRLALRSDGHILIDLHIPLQVVRLRPVYPVLHKHWGFWPSVKHIPTVWLHWNDVGQSHVGPWNPVLQLQNSAPFLSPHDRELFGLQLQGRQSGPNCQASHSVENNTGNCIHNIWDDSKIKLKNKRGSKNSEYNLHFYPDRYTIINSGEMFDHFVHPIL